LLLNKSKTIKKKTKQQQEKRLVGDQAKATYLNQILLGSIFSMN
jgi:hypothetical protein